MQHMGRDLPKNQAQMRLASENAIVTANLFNVTIVNQLWLVRNGIVEESEFIGDSVFTPAFVQVSAREFDLLVIPDRMQLAPKCDEARRGDLVASRLGHVVDLLPQTPYTAVGLNFSWEYDPSPARPIREVQQQLFCKPTAIAS